MQAEMYIDQLPDVYRATAEIAGTAIFGGLVAEPVNRFESMIFWDGGPLCISSLDWFRSLVKFPQYLLDRGEARPVKLLVSSAGERLVVWCRTLETEAGVRILGWPDWADHPAFEV